MIYHDDDYDLMKQLNEIERGVNQPQKEQLNPELRRQVDNIMKQINSLKYGDLSKRVDSLVSLNELISQLPGQNEEAMRYCCNDLCQSFTHVLVDIFERPLPDIPLRFAKYFVTIVNKTCQIRQIMQSCSEQHVYDLSE